MIVNAVEHLNQALLVVVDLVNDMRLEGQETCNMIDRVDVEVEVFLELFTFNESEIHIA